MVYIVVYLTEIANLSRLLDRTDNGCQAAAMDVRATPGGFDEYLPQFSTELDNQYIAN